MATAAKAGIVSSRALVGLLAAAIFLNYVDRGLIGVAGPLMKAELALSATGFGLAVSAFFWVYAPAQLLVGWLCDRFCVYRLFAASLALWALATAFTGFAGSLAALLALRVGLGLGESIAFPGSSKIIARHVPEGRRGIANAWIAAAISLGPAFGTFAGGMVMAGYGWRAMFVAFGLATLAWPLPWLALVRPLTGAHAGALPDGPPAAAPRALGDEPRPFHRQLRLLFPARLAAALPGAGARLLDCGDEPARRLAVPRPGGERSGLGLALRSLGRTRPA